MSVYICENSQLHPALRKQGEYNELGGAPQTPNTLCFAVLLRKMESCAYPDSDPRTAIVFVFDLSENHILRRCLEAWVLQELEIHLSPASYRACSAKQLSLDSVSLCIQEHACDDLAYVLAKTIKCAQLLEKQGE